MNIEAYISSGILEAYATGSLSPKEGKEVEDALLQYQELRDELAQIEDALESLAMLTAKLPARDTKTELMDRLEVENEDIESDSQYSLVPDRRIKYLAAASVVFALISSLMALSFWNKWQHAEEELTELLAQNSSVAENYNLVNQRLDDLQDAVITISNSGTKRIIMSGTEQSPQSLATVYWNVSSMEVYLNIQDLKDLSENQQYQLWAIIDGKPVDAGVFDISNGELVAMKRVEGTASAFAVTIEPKGGSINPTLETMQVVGTVS